MSRACSMHGGERARSSIWNTVHVDVVIFITQQFETKTHIYIYTEKILSKWGTGDTTKRGITWLIAVYHLPFLGKLNCGDPM
jgi:hypothetical protein